MNYIVILIIIIIVLIDIIPQFISWKNRIYIGRWETTEVWKVAILKKSIKWFKKTPTIKLTDNNRLIIIDILKGNYKRKSIQHWQEAGLVLGLTQVYIENKDKNIKKELINYINTKITEKGNWIEQPKEIDGVILAYAILNISWVNHQKNKPAYDAVYQLIKRLIGEDDTVQYRKSMKHYRYVDTIGFICPFLVLYGVKFKNKEALDLGLFQITAFNKYAMLQESFIPCHSYHIKTKLSVGLFGWGRGLGWYAIGLIDAWNALPEDDLDKKVLTNNVILFTKMILKFQNVNGSWNWMITSAEARADSSTTATLAWFLVNAAKIDELETECLNAKDKALNYLMKVTRRNGAIDFSQGDTKGIGVYSQNFDILPFTQGFTLRTSFLNKTE
ncbi:glycoside hydrolase family 88 protein [Lutibacter sp. A80]|uniref:glycoside hydrolase family 88 protein n=1 Tax=Lutibacter sp. A80 TaxID=2918453 RepID=UPI001F06B49B|nr:glycoside hydrolase family 88 protein [Lutibacter sp. A80]UMB60341.1 glycoside hydrolase family 88 protein [Lutibacter sp. A80]